MLNTKHFLKINPAAEADIPKMNTILKSDPNYIVGLEFTYSEISEDGTVKFYFDHPEEFTQEQEINGKLLVKKIFNEFMAFRINAN